MNTSARFLLLLGLGIEGQFNFEKEIAEIFPVDNFPKNTLRTDEQKVQDIPTGTTEKIQIKDDIVIDKKFDSDEDIGNVLLTDDTDSIPNGHPRRSHGGGYAALSSHIDVDYGSTHEGGLVSYGVGGGKKVSPKSPGPFGPASPNYKCEKSKESLFVTEIDFTVKTKCFTVFNVECKEGYTTGKVRL